VIGFCGDDGVVRAKALTIDHKPGNPTVIIIEMIIVIQMIMINLPMPVKQNSFTHLRVLLCYWYSLTTVLFVMTLCILLLLLLYYYYCAKLITN
jgi:hypothetical protein